MSVVLRRTAIVAAVVASLCMWSIPSHAVENESFGIIAQPEVVNGVHRASFEIPLEIAATYQDAVKVFNKTDQPIDLSLYPADAQGRGPSNVTIGFSDQHPTGIGSWITLSLDKVSLPPHGDATITFTVNVKSSTPSPNIGAIVVENTATGLSRDLAERLDILVRTVPRNTTTTSQRVRPLPLRSPWVILAILGLIVAIVLVVIGWRRSRRTKDTLVAPGEVAGTDHQQEIPVASLPVIRRLGASTQLRRYEEEEEEDEARPLLDDDLLVEIDEPMFIDDDEDYDDDELDEVDLPPARPRTAKPNKAPAKPVKTAKRKPTPRKPVAKRKPAPKRKPAVPTRRPARNSNYIPLEDL